MQQAQRKMCGSDNAQRLAKYAMLVVFAFALQGCAYTYDGKTYHSKEAATAAAKLNVSTNVAGVTKSSPYVGGKALVVIPPRDIITKNGVVIKKQGIGLSEMKEYITDVLENDFLGTAEAVEKGGFFDSVVVSREVSGTQSENPDYVVELETTGLGQWQWYLYRANDASNKIPLHSEGTKKGADKLNSFNDSLGKGLISLGNKEKNNS